MVWPPQDHQDVQDEITSLLAAGGAGAATASDELGLSLTKVGQVLLPGPAGAWDSDQVESPVIGLDPETGQWAMTYTGYGVVDGVQRAQAGLAYSIDKITWAKTGTPILGFSGGTTEPDRGGITGPVWLYDEGQYHLFYIGLTESGYEGGFKTICHATAPSLTGPWTRHGTIIAPSSAGTGWRSSQVWHPNLVKRGDTWFMFFNATEQGTGFEQIGYATADSLMGPWTVDDINSPIVAVGPLNSWDERIAGDPCVRRVGDLWIMDYYGLSNFTDKSCDGVAYTTDDQFPLGWVKHSANPILEPGATYDSVSAHKPWTMMVGGQLLHYYTAVAAGGARNIALAVSGDVGAAGGAATKISTPAVEGSPASWITSKTEAAKASSLAVGDDIAIGTMSGRARVQVGNTNGNSELLVGQASNRALLFNWTYNATVANAVANLETYAGGNEVRIQYNSGALRIGGTSGKVGFFGATPNVRPVLSYSRAGESAAEAALRTALTTLGLVTDSTTA